MLVIRGKNVNDIFPIGIMHLKAAGVKRESRNGSVLEIPTTVCVHYDYPDERVLVSKERDANPFFHLFESLWMLAGRNDVAFLDQYNSGMKQYSDDGQGFNAAYGQRLRTGFNFDQLDEAIMRLKRDPDDRRIVLQIWDPSDLKKQTLDMACNLTITPRVRNGNLDWTVFNRSNDYLFGLTGANVVHMSIIHEYVARMANLRMGSYEQITNCLHVYTETDAWNRVKDLPLTVDCPYDSATVTSFPLITYKETWMNDLLTWMDNPSLGLRYQDPFFNFVARPMAVAHKAHKDNKDGLQYINQIKATDWRMACEQWLKKREEV